MAKTKRKAASKKVPRSKTATGRIQKKPKPTVKDIKKIKPSSSELKIRKDLQTRARALQKFDATMSIILMAIETAKTARATFDQPFVLQESVKADYGRALSDLRIVSELVQENAAILHDHKSIFCNPISALGGSHFDRLPIELREKIYGLLLVEPHNGQVPLYPYETDAMEIKYFGLINTHLFGVCRQIRNEAKNVMYEKNVFIIGRQMPRDVMRTHLLKGVLNFELDPRRIEKVYFTTRENCSMGPRSLKKQGYYFKNTPLRLKNFVDKFMVHHSLKHLMVDCLHGFENIEVEHDYDFKKRNHPYHVLKYLGYLHGLQYVHIVVDRHAYVAFIQRLQKTMVSNNPLFNVGQKSILPNYVVSGPRPTKDEWLVHQTEGRYLKFLLGLEKLNIP